ncbi:hypothetical protein DENIS_3522 [Desulfonema ishimotonii]|uniref:Uncharacterized protein n=1 Tax=Desulfonema ishimotonii TaxID=45657 RepID=A0A401G014_9BACT|nr:hypothetical protein [Desulfonema ishimotonii]GBC62550.1 hypothetical protein DENIS_3522 [Desulfonema ishimotonii]
MKTGIIVYVVGSQFSDDTFDEKKAVRSLDVKADRVSFVFSGEKEDDLAYSWCDMTQKGMSRILCMTGVLTAPSMVRLVGHEMQLTGY